MPITRIQPSSDYKQDELRRIQDNLANAIDTNTTATSKLTNVAVWDAGSIFNSATATGTGSTVLQKAIVNIGTSTPTAYNCVWYATHPGSIVGFSNYFYYAIPPASVTYKVNTQNGLRVIATGSVLTQQTFPVGQFPFVKGTEIYVTVTYASSQTTTSGIGVSLTLQLGT